MRVRAHPRARAASLRLLTAGVGCLALAVTTAALGAAHGWAVPAGLALAGLAFGAAGLAGVRGRLLFSSVSLRLEQEPLELGGAAIVRLECESAGGFLAERLSLHLRCHERALLCDQGREHVFVKKVFEKTVALGERLRVEPGVRLSYPAQFRLPADRAPTFAAASCSLEWSVVLEVQLAGWPAATRDWTVVVAPVIAA
ncbi:MAG: hypothetical protein HYY25_07405 [Candidatus Wallbacteria bacterium]|nr:hypothetical protein [Candidatus Wallbacteria bacterium]